jgi:hypothetical protein
MITAKHLKAFMKDVPDSAQVIFSEGIITFMFGDNTLALNKYGGQWDNGVGYAFGGTSCCGECSHFDCSKCREEKPND